MYYPRKIPSSFLKQDGCIATVPIFPESKEKHANVRKNSLSPFAAFLFWELLKKEKMEKPPPAYSFQK